MTKHDSNNPLFDLMTIDPKLPCNFGIGGLVRPAPRDLELRRVEAKLDQLIERVAELTDVQFEAQKVATQITGRTIKLEEFRDTWKDASGTKADGHNYRGAIQSLDDDFKKLRSALNRLEKSVVKKN